MGVDEFSPRSDQPHRDAAIYSLTTDPQYIYLIDPVPTAEDHVVDRCQGWSLLQRYAVLQYEIEPQGDPFDAWDPNADQHVEVKSCRYRHENDRHGEFEFYANQHHRLIAADGEYIFVIYDNLPKHKRAPNSGKWIIRAHIRLPADTIHELFTTGFNPAQGRGYKRKRLCWTRIPGLTPSRVAGNSTTDCNEFVE